MVDMINLKFFKTFICSCFKPKEQDKDIGAFDLGSKLYDVTRQYKISILPIPQNFDIDNLYPITDHVELWNIFIVGNDKTYILVNINDPHIIIPNTRQLPNHKAQNIMPEELVKLLDSIWDKTLLGKQLQFYMVWDGKLYFINTYPFFNGQNKVIGAILFMRTFETIENEIREDMRKSLDKERNSNEFNSHQHPLSQQIPQNVAERSKIAKQLLI